MTLSELNENLERLRQLRYKQKRGIRHLSMMEIYELQKLEKLCFPSYSLDEKKPDLKKAFQDFINADPVAKFVIDPLLDAVLKGINENPPTSDAADVIAFIFSSKDQAKTAVSENAKEETPEFIKKHFVEMQTELGKTREENDQLHKKNVEFKKMLIDKDAALTSYRGSFCYPYPRFAGSHEIHQLLTQRDRARHQWSYYENEFNKILKEKEILKEKNENQAKSVQEYRDLWSKVSGELASADVKIAYFEKTLQEYRDANSRLAGENLKFHGEIGQLKMNKDELQKQVKIVEAKCSGFEYMLAKMDPFSEAFYGKKDLKFFGFSFEELYELAAKHGKKS